MKNNGEGVLKPEELDNILAKCLGKGMTPEECYQVAQELNTMRVSEILLRGVLSGDIDFIIKGEEVCYTQPLTEEEEDFPEYIH